MSRMDLIETNAKIMRSVAENIAKYAPDAVVINVANPLDEMTALAQIVTGFDKHKSWARPACSTRPASRTSSPSARRAGRFGDTLTLGSHGDTMVPVPSRCTVDGAPLSSC